MFLARLLIVPALMLTVYAAIHASETAQVFLVLPILILMNAADRWLLEPAWEWLKRWDYVN